VCALIFRSPRSNGGGGTVRGWNYRTQGAGQPRGCPTRPAIEQASPCYRREKAALFAAFIGLVISGVPIPALLSQGGSEYQV